MREWGLVLYVQCVCSVVQSTMVCLREIRTWEGAREGATTFDVSEFRIEYADARPISHHRARANTQARRSSLAHSTRRSPTVYRLTVYGRVKASNLAAECESLGALVRRKYSLSRPLTRGTSVRSAQQLP